MSYFPNIRRFRATTVAGLLRLHSCCERACTVMVASFGVEVYDDEKTSCAFSARAFSLPASLCLLLGRLRCRLVRVAVLFSAIVQEREWDQACSAFFQSFKNYDEAGDPERLQVRYCKETHDGFRGYCCCCCVSVVGATRFSRSLHANRSCV